MYNIQQAGLDILRQSNQVIYVKLELLNQQFQIIDELQGEMIDGSHSIDSESDIRTTANISFVVKDSTYLVGSDRKIWLDKYVRLYIGVLYQRSQEILWYPMGTFLFNENSYSYDSTSRTLSVNLLDLMCKLTGIRNGQVKGLLHTIPSGSDIRGSMIAILSEGGEFYNYIIDDIGKTVPYDLEFSASTTVYEMIKKIRDLYPAWETYFDDITFICKEIPMCIDDNIVLDAEIIAPLVKSENLSNTFEKVKNVTDIWGKCIEGYQVHAIVKEYSIEPTILEKENDIIYESCTNIKYVINPDSPYGVDKIGEIRQVLSGGEYENIHTDELCLLRAEYENWRTTRLQDTISLETMMIPWLGVNQKIEYKSKITNVTEQYITKSINRSLSDWTQTIDMIKFYPLYPFIVE